MKPIKWPNDIYWRDRKAGGILIENILRGPDWLFAVAGIGININQSSFPTDLQNPVSLKQVTGRQYDVLALAHELCDRLDAAWQRFAAGEDLLEEYNSRLFRLGQPVKLKKDNAIFETTIEGASADGQLITRDTIERRFDFGEVEWVI